MPVIAADELQHLVAARHSASQTQGRHGGLRTGVHHTHHVHAGERVHDHAGQLDLGRARRAVTGSLSGSFDDRLGHVGMGMTEQHRAPRFHEIDHFLTVHGGHAAPLGRGDEQRVGSHAETGAHGAVHPSGNQFAGFLKQCIRTGRFHKLLKNGCGRHVAASVFRKETGPSPRPSKNTSWTSSSVPQGCRARRTRRAWFRGAARR